MIPVPSRTIADGTVRVWLATGHTDMRNYAECTIRGVVGMLVSRRAVVLGTSAAAIALPALALPARARLVGPIYRTSDLPYAMYQGLMQTRWHLDEHSDGMLIRHCQTGLTYRVVEPGYPLAIQELSFDAAMNGVEPTLAYRIGCAARTVVASRYWTMTYRRAHHRGAVYYTIQDNFQRVLEDAPRIQLEAV